MFDNLICNSSHHRAVRSSNETASTVVDFPPAVITGLRVEEVDKGVSYEEGIPIVLAGATVSVYIYRLTIRNLSIKLPPWGGGFMFQNFWSSTNMSS